MSMELIIQIVLSSIIPIIGFLIGFIIIWYRQGVKGINEVVDAIVNSFLDERGFRQKDLMKKVDLPEPAVNNALNRLSKTGILTKRRAWYRLNDPLVFLSEKDMIRASRLTKDDNIIYAAYQNPFLSNIEFLLIYGFLFTAVIFSGICFFVPQSYDWLVSVIPAGFGTPSRLDVGALLLYIIMVGLILSDISDDLVKIWGRERFQVVVGALSGISYDVSYSDELSGRIMRGAIKNIDIDITGSQKFLNYFLPIPVGNIEVATSTSKKSIRSGKGVKVFRNMPYPREMFFVLRSLQLKSLGWRKRNAKTLMLWRSRGSAMVPA
ncbi:MAG: hypothetical protein GF329_08155 [Candidatus Lokiarchaeota archaeon]|nr:hypothetical protein [Candidatus Lokiarchaeota archaeon]